MNRQGLPRIEVRALSPADAGAVELMESRFHIASLRDNAATHAQRLHEADRLGVNLSFGAFADGSLVGYLLCYGFQGTTLPSEMGTALYVEDVVVDPGFRYGAALLLRRFSREVSRWFPGAPVEAHSIERVARIWRLHDRFSRACGYAIASEHDTGEVIANSPRKAIRWEPALPDTSVSLRRTLASLPRMAIRGRHAEYRLAAIQTESEWNKLEECWDKLLDLTPDKTVFQSYRYQRLWWKHFGAGSELFIVVISLDDQIVGIAPLRTYRQRAIAGLSRRKLTFIGSRWQVDRPQFIFPVRYLELTAVLARFLAQDDTKWDIAAFYEQLDDIDSVEKLAQAFRAEGLLVGVSRDSECPYIDLKGSWPEFLARKGKKLRNNLSRARRRLSQLGDLTHRVVDSPPELTLALDEYRELESRSWKPRYGADISGKPEAFEFYREAAEVFGATGDFILQTLLVGNHIAASTFGLAYRGAFYSLQIAHDKDYAEHSPGTYLESLEIELCFARGFREIDLLGGFLSNKVRWATDSRPTRRISLYRRTPALLAVYILKYRIKPLARKLARTIKAMLSRAGR